MKRLLTAAAAALVLLGTATACSSGSDDADAASGGASGAATETTLTVYAAASLQVPFEQIGEEFEAAHEGVTVQFSFAGSSDLVSQIQQGAPADVLATADTNTMDDLVADGLNAEEPVDFATNTLMIAVPAGNPAGVETLADLADPDLKLVICAEQVPCGNATKKVAEAAGLTLTPVSEEQSVTDVLTKVSSGEADAGLVYVTDVAKAGDAVEGIAFDESAEAVNTYPITTIEGSENAELGQEFVAYVLGDGQTALSDAGFLAPGE
ncbi:molybdate ABC transporter substrate-binding protein [Brachybacterium sp. DNPG3]